MKYRVWLLAFLAATALEALLGLVGEALDWFTVRARRWSDAAEVEVLLARTERALAAGRARRARAASGGGPRP